MRISVRCRSRGDEVMSSVFIERGDEFVYCGWLIVRKGAEYAALVRMMKGAEIVSEGPPGVTLTPADWERS